MGFENLKHVRVVTRALPSRSRWWPHTVLSLMAEISHDDENNEGKTPRRFFAKHRHIAELLWGGDVTKRQVTQVSEAIGLLREHGLLRLVKAAANQQRAEYELIFDPEQIEIEKQVYAYQKAQNRPRYELAAAKTRAIQAARKYQEAVGNVAVVEAEITVAEHFQMDPGIPLRGIPQHPLEGDDQHPLEGDTQDPLEGDALKRERLERDSRETKRETSPEVTNSPAPHAGPVDNSAIDDDPDPELTAAKALLNRVGPGRYDVLLERAARDGLTGRAQIIRAATFLTNGVTT